MFEKIRVNRCKS